MSEQSFNIISPEVRGNALKAVSLAPDGYEVVIRPRAKTSAQRRYLHAIMGVLANFTGYTLEQVKWVVKEKVLGLEKWEIKGKTYAMVPPSEKLDIKEYSVLIDETVKIAHKLDCKLPPPSYYGIQLEKN